MDFSNTGLDGANRFGADFSPKDLIPARVYDIILDSSHPEWNKYAQYNAAGAIKYATLETTQDVDNPETLSVAFPINSTYRHLPLKNEIVLLIASPSYKSSDVEYSGITYYTTVVGLWNTPNHNALPIKDTEEVDLGKVKINGEQKEIEEKSTINPLQPFPGDTLIEGRLGQSIRFSGYPHSLNTFVDDENQTLPLTIISNGQVETESGVEHIVEDVNEDYSSIYLTSNHTIPLTPARSKRLAFTDEPIEPTSFKGNQVVVNGGRLYFNAKEEDVLITAQGNIGLTSNIIGIDSVDYIGLDSNKIYLGAEARKNELQPVILGNQLEILLASLLTSMDRLGGVLSTATTASGISLPTLNLEGFSLQAVAQSLSKQINPNGPSLLKSKKVFTE